MDKRCQWGLCNSDNRYPDRLVGDIEFISFPKRKFSTRQCSLDKSEWKLQELPRSPL
ncbi:hypothetical protein DPMN_073477 [Dreissena polymorpha]|uniref:Uncharacterized protein n=1 Tax=Dreissena polymorpha TaxID=45954 RepID=A0A9D4BZ78_DREPO|nr:hypothetical protein DPMN_073477 [Dreissena polymorpha]